MPLPTAATNCSPLFSLHFSTNNTFATLHSSTVSAQVVVKSALCVRVVKSSKNKHKNNSNCTGSSQCHLWKLVNVRPNGWTPTVSCSFWLLHYNCKYLRPFVCARYLPTTITVLESTSNAISLAKEAYKVSSAAILILSITFAVNVLTVSSVHVFLHAVGVVVCFLQFLTNDGKLHGYYCRV